MTDIDTEDAAEVAVSALAVYMRHIGNSNVSQHTSRDADLIAASNLVAADTIATAILEASQ